MRWPTSSTAARSRSSWSAGASRRRPSCGPMRWRSGSASTCASSAIERTRSASSGPATSSPCRATRSRSGWSTSRRCGAGSRWSGWTTAARRRSSSTGSPACCRRRATGAGLAANLAKLLDDPALRERLGAAGQERVAEHFGADRLAADMAAIYREVIARRSRDVTFDVTEDVAIDVARRSAARAASAIAVSVGFFSGFGGEARPCRRRRTFGHRRAPGSTRRARRARRSACMRTQPAVVHRRAGPRPPTARG